MQWPLMALLVQLDSLVSCGNDLKTEHLSKTTALFKVSTLTMITKHMTCVTASAAAAGLIDCLSPELGLQELRADPH